MMTDAFEAIKKKLRLFLTSGLSKTKVSLCVWIKILDFEKGIDDFFGILRLAVVQAQKLKANNQRQASNLGAF